MKKRILLFTILASLAALLCSCEEFLTAEDSRYVKEGEQMEEALLINPEAAVRGIYARLITREADGHNFFGQKSTDISLDMRGEDICFDPAYHFTSDYRLVLRLATHTRPTYVWQAYYQNINDANIVLLNLTDPTQQVTRNLKGELLALRAHAYFYLINLYQMAGSYSKVKGLPGIPLYTESSSRMSRGTVEEIYNRIAQDLDDAIPLLEGFVRSEINRIDQRVAKALRARVAMFMGDYDIAERYATEVIAAAPLMSAMQYQAEGFINASNSEWLWGQIITQQTSTGYASFHSFMSPAKGPGYASLKYSMTKIDRRLYDQMSSNDTRKGCFLDGTGLNFAPGTRIDATLTSSSGYASYIKNAATAYVGFKFNGEWTSPLLYMRVAEMYYIKAEAQVRQSNIPGAQATLDIISNARAISGTHDYVWESNADALIDQIFYHKRFECWGEGVCYFDFNRLEKTVDRTYTGTNHPVTSITAGFKPYPWGHAIRTYQIPNRELSGNPEITDADNNPNP